MKTLDDEILAVQRMARCSRYWARAARATAAEFAPDLAEVRRRLVEKTCRAEDFVDVRTVTMDKEAEARNHDREADELEAVVRRLEEMRAVLQSFRIDPPDADGDVWLWMEHQGSGRSAGFNLGKPVNESQPDSSGARVKISHHVAALLETARQSAVGDRP